MSNFENIAPSNQAMPEEGCEGVFRDDCQQIKELLSEIGNSPVAEVKPFAPKSADSDVESVVTEPTDSPFRVRRVSRSFSICNAKEGNDLFCAENDSEFVASPLPSGKKSRFLILRRSRSLGNIFTQQITREEVQADESSQNELTEQVEALEVEVLSSNESAPETTEAEDESLAREFNTRISLSVLIDEAPLSPSSVAVQESPVRPQTSPPILLNGVPPRSATDSPTTKSSIMDRMQKSLGFFFRCTRRDSVETEGLPKTPSPTPRTARSRARAIEMPNSRFTAVSSRPSVQPPMQPIAVNNEGNFAASVVAKVDAPPVHRLPVRTLPAFHDISGPKGPLLPLPLQIDVGKKCLVLDLDETLVHSSFHIPEAHDLVVPLALPEGGIQNIYVAKRPGVDQFLARVCERFEVVIFTASLSRYADPVIDFLTAGLRQYTEKGEIRHRLYRESCLFLQGLYVKDLSRLGRDLSQTVIVDNSPASFLLQPDHGIPIKSWFDDIYDRELDFLADSLSLLDNAPDVQSWRKLLQS